MKRLPLLLTSLLTVLAVPVVVAPPAVAKGATDVVVTGPGIDHVSLGFTRDMTDVDVGSLAETSGIYGIFGDGEFVARPGLTPAELGPRYDLTWYMGTDVMTTSHVYPFAEGGAWAEVPDGQEAWHVTFEGGWWHAGAALEGQLVELGAEAPADAAAAPVVSGGPTDAGSGSTSSSAASPVPVAGLAGLAALVVLVGVGGWLLRRRTGTLAGWSLHRST